MFFALLLVSLVVSIKDIQTHRISNRALIASALLFLTLSSVSSTKIYLASALIILALAPLFLIAGIGAGDIKLLALLAFFFLTTTWASITKFLLAFSLIALTCLVQQVARKRSFSGSIALAPAICGAVIWCAISGSDLPQYAHALAYSR